MFGRAITVSYFRGDDSASSYYFSQRILRSIGPGGIFAAFFLMYVIFVGVFTWLDTRV